MTAYIIKLLVMLPLVGALAFASLWLWRKVQPGLAGGHSERRLKLVETLAMGTTDRLALVEFEGKKLLLSVSRGRIELLSEAAPAAQRGSRKKPQQ